MSYQANLDIVISLSSLQTYAFRKQGSLRFRLCIYHGDLNQNKKNFKPQVIHKLN
jgi:hypothetical protein